MQSRNTLRVRKLEPEFLRVVAHRLNGRQLQVHPSLVTADEDLDSLLGDGFGGGTALLL
jgi:hypothetical protein